jgi:NCS1 family nucleobase:cation symporter-1
MSRISFGIRGAQIASLLRGAVAIAWFGIQTYLASVVFRVMLVAMMPSLGALDKDSVLGLSTLGWIAFVILWIVQLVIVSYGMEMIRKYEAFAGPVILVTMAAVAIWIFVQAGGAIAWSSDDALAGPEMWLTIFAGGALWGIPINMLVFGVIVVVMAGGQFRINGTIIQSPSDIVQTIPTQPSLSWPASLC